MDICRHHLHGALHVLVFGQLTAPSDRAFSLPPSLSVEQQDTCCGRHCPSHHGLKHSDILSLPQFKFAPLAFVEMGDKSGLGGWRVRHTESPHTFPPIFLPSSLVTSGAHLQPKQSWPLDGRNAGAGSD
jgi:hypothetical protein